MNLSRTFLLCIPALLAFHSSASASIVVTASPFSQTGTIGSTVTYALTIAGLGSGTAPSLGNFNIDILFPGTLSYASTSYVDPTHGNQLALIFPAITAEFVSQSGVVLTIGETSLDDAAVLDSQQLPSFQFASVKFNVLTTGVQTISLQNGIFGDSMGSALGVTINDGGGGGGGDTPEPSTWLLGISALGLLWISKSFTTRPAAVITRS